MKLNADDADLRDLSRSVQKRSGTMQRVPDDLHAALTGEIIGAFYHVYNTLGYGFLESVYQNALLVTLRKHGRQAEVQQPVDVYFEGVVVGHYYADLIVDRLVIIELKSVESLCEAHEAQLLNYLRATDIEVGLLLNFGPKPQIKRKVFSNKRNRDFADDHDQSSAPES